MNERVSGSTAQDTMQLPLRHTYTLWVVLAVFTATCVIVGTAYYRQERRAFVFSVHQELSAIADLKSAQIAEWRLERLRDAELIMRNDVFNRYTDLVLTSRAPGHATAGMQVWLQALVDAYDYHSVVLLDGNGIPRLAAGTAPAVGSYGAAQVMETLRTRRPSLSDLHRADVVSVAHLDLLVPLNIAAGTNRAAACAGVLLIRIDPYRFLYPLIQSWPAPSETAETLLVRRATNEVVYLNELRHASNTVLNVRIPLTRMDVPAVKAVLGTRGVTEGIDYRGVPVLAVIRAVSNTPWLMIAKVDMREAFAPLNARMWQVVLVVATLIAMAGLGVAAAWRYRQMAFYRLHYHNQRERTALAQHYEYLTKYANDIILLLNLDGQIVEANERAVMAYGWPREELLGMNVRDLRSPRARAAIEADLQRVRERDGLTYTAENQRKDGTCFPVEVSARVIEVEGVPFYQCIVRDVSERMQAERALRESELRYRTLFDTMLDAFALHEIICDDRGVPCDYRFLDVNPAFERMMGLNRIAVLGKRVREVMPDIEQRWIDLYGAVAQTGQPAHFEDYAASLGKYFEGEAYSLERGRFAVVFADVTARRRAQEERRQLELQLQHTQKLESLGLLAGGIAHDFNNMLVAILGNADLALSELPPISPACASVREIEKASRRAAELCRQLLAYSGKGKFVVAALNLSQVVEEMRHMLEISISKNVVVKYRLSPNLPSIEADTAQAVQVLMNLVMNASESIGTNSGIVSITTGVMECDRAYLRDVYVAEGLAEGMCVTLEVADTGCGMDKATQARIFDPFFTTKFTGRGLGLAAVLGIVRGHKGAIKVYSEPGKGSTFKLLLPASELPARPLHADQPQQAEAWRGQGAILLVDDEESIRTLGKRMLERIGFAVVVAPDGRDALTIFRERAAEFVCVILDLTMPHMSGEETFRELRRIRPGIRVIMSSGYNEQEVSQQFVGKGMAAFIQKPYDSAALIAKVREVLGA